MKLFAPKTNKCRWSGNLTSTIYSPPPRAFTNNIQCRTNGKFYCHTNQIGQRPHCLLFKMHFQLLNKSDQIRRLIHSSTLIPQILYIEIFFLRVHGDHKIALQLRQPIYRKIFCAITEAKRTDDMLIDTIYRKKILSTHRTRINLRLRPKTTE